MLVLLLLLVLFAPVHLMFTWDQKLRITPSVWGIPLPRKRKRSPTGAGFIRDQLMRWLGTALRTNRARRFFLRHIELLQLQALIHLGLQSAARTAFFTGVIQQLLPFLPHNADIRIVPDFLHGTQIQARCIVFFHLGTLIITAGMVFLAYLMEAHEHPTARAKEA